MAKSGHNTIPQIAEQVGCGFVPHEANFGRPSQGAYEEMARRRFHDPKPVLRGHWWTLLVWKDHFVGTEHKRKRERIKLAPATMSEREVRKIATEHFGR
jgi:hypothetical protein